MLLDVPDGLAEDTLSLYVDAVSSWRTRNGDSDSLAQIGLAASASLAALVLGPRDDEGSLSWEAVRIPNIGGVSRREGRVDVSG